MRQLDEDRRFAGMAAGGAAPGIDGMDIGEARELGLAVMHVGADSFAGATEELPDIDKLRILNICLSDLAAIIRGHDGHVEKYAGDGTTALFGAGKGRPAAAKDAVECAMTIRAEVNHVIGDYLQQAGLPAFACSIGIDYGATWVARVGARGSSQLALVGSEAGIARDLEELAGGDEILVGERVRSALSPKRQGCCERRRQGGNFGWKMGGRPHPYYKYGGQWAVR